jgi:hypothetical protein
VNFLILLFFYSILINFHHFLNYFYKVYQIPNYSIHFNYSFYLCYQKNYYFDFIIIISIYLYFQTSFNWKNYYFLHHYYYFNTYSSILLNDFFSPPQNHHHLLYPLKNFMKNSLNQIILHLVLPKIKMISS